MFSVMPFGFLFIFILTFGSIFSLSSLHWLSIWMGLEVNLMGFIPILVYRGITQETESGMKYFIAQALGSGMVMMGSLVSFKMSLSWETIFNLNTESPTPESMGLVILIFGLFLKLGNFPFHFWLPGVMAGLSWASCLILTTWQKLAPIFLLSALVQSWMNSWLMNFMLLIAGMSSMAGGIGGLNQTQIRALLAYSSIGHMGWMIFCSTLTQSVLKTYFVIYFTVSLCMFMTLWLAETSFFNQIGPLSLKNKNLGEICLILMLLSLGGMPPLLGFIGKWLAIWSCCITMFPVMISFLLMGSLISLFYYLSLLFSTIFLSGSNLSSDTQNNLTTQYLTFSTPFKILGKATPNPKKHNNNSSTTMNTINMVMVFNLIGGLFIPFMLPITDFL